MPSTPKTLLPESASPAARPPATARPPAAPKPDPAPADLAQFDPERGAGPVPSPCINVCQINPATLWCRGCQRSGKEIAAWRHLGEDDKRALWRQIHARRAA